MERSKFNVDKDKEKRTLNGIVFDSILEMRYYRDVILPLMESGDILACELQKPYELQPKFTHNKTNIQPIMYVADFFIEYSDGRQEIIDTKGCPDSVAKIKRKMFWYQHPDYNYKWITYVKKYGGWISYELAQQKRREEKRIKKEISLDGKKEA